MPLIFQLQLCEAECMKYMHLSYNFFLDLQYLGILTTEDITSMDDRTEYGQKMLVCLLASKSTETYNRFLNYLREGITDPDHKILYNILAHNTHLGRCSPLSTKELFILDSMLAHPKFYDTMAYQMGELDFRDKFLSHSCDILDFFETLEGKTKKESGRELVQVYYRKNFKNLETLEKAMKDCQERHPYGHLYKTYQELKVQLSEQFEMKTA